MLPPVPPDPIHIMFRGRARKGACRAALALALPQAALALPGIGDIVGQIEAPGRIFPPAKGGAAAPPAP